MTEYTPKQQDLMSLWKRGELRRLNLLEGAVSSGKTWISLVLWAFWVASMPEDKRYLMCAKSLTTLKRNCLLLLQELVGESNFAFSTSSKEGLLFGRRVLLEGASDARAESKIRGLTLQGAYCDELTQFPEDFFSMLLSRLRLPGAKLIATTNPDNPGHWLMQRYIKRAEKLDFLDVKFTIDDNTTLPPDYVENIKKEYTGVFYDRFIRGLWVAAEGLVYPMFDPGRHVFQEPRLQGPAYISIDYGTANPFAMGLWVAGRSGEAEMVKEYYFDSRKARRQKTDEEYYQDLEDFAGDYAVDRVIVDPSAASFIECVRRHGRYAVVKADNSVLDGIRLTGALLQAGKLRFHQSCTSTFEEFSAYLWDGESGEDKVIKERDHAMDMIRYFAQTILRREIR